SNWVDSIADLARLIPSSVNSLLWSLPYTWRLPGCLAGDFSARAGTAISPPASTAAVIARPVRSLLIDLSLWEAGGAWHHPQVIVVLYPSPDPRSQANPAPADRFPPRPPLPLPGGRRPGKMVHARPRSSRPPASGCS